MSQINQKISDDLAIQRCLDGENEAFGELVCHYQDRLFHALVHAFGDRTEAEDVVQEAFVQAFIKLSSFRRDSSFYTWLYRIAFNTSISRKRRKRPALSVDQTRETMGDEPIDQGEGPEHQLQRRERADEVREALERVSEEHRTILVLREMEDMDYESISEILDLPIGTVRSRLHRARSQLKVELEKVEMTNPKQ